MNKEELLHHLRKQGYSESIINAFANVKRENFAPNHLASYAYEDMPLPIETGATISQPSTIAFMLKLLDLKQGQKILEIGSGSGYSLALISHIIKEGKIYGLELIKRLAIKSKILLQNDTNIKIFNKNGFKGLKEYSPYHRIIISASAESIPSHLIHQLDDNGILVAPVNQSIFCIKKENGKIIEKEYPGFAFVPLIKGEEL
jgi:protein-L-isoaspartate(D-aspartate) O-methyltransferase